MATEVDFLPETFYTGDSEIIFSFHSMPILLTKQDRAARKIKARFSRGKIEPLEQLRLREGEEIIISLEEVPASEKKTRTRAKPFTGDDSLWKLVGIGRAEGTTDVSQNKHQYIADAYSQKEQ